MTDWMSMQCDPNHPVSIPLIEDWDGPGPGWLKTIDSGGNNLKPLIKCQCGYVTGIGLHHVHPDGRVTASFVHNVAPIEQAGHKFPGGGCGWHVFLKLDGYDLGDFPSRQG